MSDRELDRAGITGHELRAAYATGMSLFKKHARGRANTRYMFPAAKRPYLDIFFGFVVYLDDLVDDADHSVEVRATRLDEWERVFSGFVKDEPPDWDRPPSATERADAALAKAFVHVMRTWELPLDKVPEYLDGQRTTLHTREYTTEAQLDEFLRTVTLLPAVWVNQIFEPTSTEAEELCRQAVTAFQLIDFLWDLHDDLKVGRRYLPAEHLSRFGLSRERMARAVGSGQPDPAVRELARFEIDRAKSHLDIGKAWPDALHPTSATFLRLDIQAHYWMLAELAKDDCAFFFRPAKPAGRFARWVLPRSLATIAKAARVNRKAVS